MYLSSFGGVCMHLFYIVTGGVYVQKCYTLLFFVTGGICPKCYTLSYVVGSRIVNRELHTQQNLTARTYIEQLIFSQ